MTSMKIKASKGCTLVVKATDCEVDMNLGRVIIRCRNLSVNERKDRRTVE